MSDLFDWLDEAEARRVFLFRDAPSGLRAICAIDDLGEGLVAGGIRTRRYEGAREAIADACGLARAMSVKCALAGLPTGGCKIVVVDHDGMDRPAAFEALGRHLAELGDRVRTAGDFGTEDDDLRAVARFHSHVHLGETGLADSVGRGLLRCIEACAEWRGTTSSQLHVAVQGCGKIGSAVARSLAAAGASLTLSDRQTSRAEALARELGAAVVSPDAILTVEADILSPNAVGGVLDEAAVEGLRVWGVVGAANNILTGAAVAARLRDRGIVFVPDVIASAGAVVDGIGATVMGLVDRGPLVDQLGATAREVIEQAERTGQTTVEVAQRVADLRMAERARRGRTANAGR
jgi:leucine dehydrogenase